MDKITIPGNKKTKPKTFKLGEIYLFQIGYDWVEQIGKVVEINDSQIVFESIFSKRINRATTKQFSSITKTAKKATLKHNKREIFDSIFKYENFKYAYST